MKKNFKGTTGLIILMVAILVWLFSFYKIVDYLRQTKIVGAARAMTIGGFENLIPPLPPFPPLPPGIPCLPICPSPTPTPSPAVEPTPTPPPGGGGNGSSVGGPGGGGPPVCGAQVPAAPYLRSVNTLGGGEVELFWDPVEPTTHYNISYGPSSGNYLYGVNNTGKVTSFKVGGLGSGNYCFVVRAVNDCAPSEASNEVCTAPGQVLGVSTLGATGSLGDELEQILFIIGSVCIAIGLRFLSPAKRLV